VHQIERFLATVDFLPPAPQILAKLLPLLGNPDVEAARIVELIRLDPALTAQILHASNAAALAPSQKTTDLLEAVTMLGFGEVYRRVAIVSGLSLLRVSKDTYGINTEGLWKHSAVTALAAQLLAKRSGEDESMAFMSGLLHDLGKVVLAEKLRERYATLLVQAGLNKAAAVDFEQETIGLQHAEIGGQLLARWCFNPGIIAPVWFHHAPSRGVAFETLTASVCVGNLSPTSWRTASTATRKGRVIQR
jgi:putative nucleotidyltransferase with HDIG domain